MLVAEHLPRAAEAGLHFVDDEDDAVLPREVAELPHERNRRWNEATFPELGLHDHGRDVGRDDVRVKQLIQCLHGAIGGPAAVLVGKGRVIDVGGEGSEVLAVHGTRSSQRQAEQGPSVKSSVERDHARSPRVRPCDLHGVLGRLRSRCEQNRLVRGVADEAGKPRRQLDVRFVHRHLKAGVGDAIELLTHRVDHAWMAMPSVEHADAAREVQVFLAVGIPQASAFGARREGRMGVRKAAWHVEVACRHGPVSRFHQRHRSASLRIALHNASTCERSVGSAPIETRTIQRPCSRAGVR
jgi:hypothetical protein